MHRRPWPPGRHLLRLSCIEGAGAGESDRRGEARREGSERPRVGMKNGTSLARAGRVRARSISASLNHDVGTRPQSCAAPWLLKGQEEGGSAGLLARERTGLGQPCTSVATGAVATGAGLCRFLRAQGGAASLFAKSARSRSARGLLQRSSAPCRPGISLAPCTRCSGLRTTSPSACPDTLIPPCSSGSKSSGETPLSPSALMRRRPGLGGGMRSVTERRPCAEGGGRPLGGACGMLLCVSVRRPSLRRTQARGSRSGRQLCAMSSSSLASTYMRKTLP